MPTIKDHDHVIQLKQTIYRYEICSNDFAYNLICLALKDRISLILVGLPEETNEFVWHQVQDFDIPHGDMICNAIAFSPDTALNCTPNKVAFCVALGACDIKLFHTDLDQCTLVQSLKGHTKYVNDVSWVCDGEYIASVSDDFTCKFWSTEDPELVITFCLSSAGMSVKSHPDDINKVLVAEKRGIIHFYNVRNKHTIISVESPKFPLMSADWANSNRMLVTALAGGDIVTWDLYRPFVPADIKQVHEDGGRVVRFSPGNTEIAMASVGRPNLTLKVFMAKSKVPLIETTLKSYGGLAWHRRLPYITAASEKSLYFWKLLIK